MTKNEVELILEGILDKEVFHLEPPSLDDWNNLQKKFNSNFPDEFKFFIDLMAIYSFPGDILNVSSGKTNGNDTIEFTYNFEMKNGSWNEYLIPFYSIGNGDYFCLHAKESSKSAVYYYYHEDNRIERYTNTFEEWIRGLPDFLN